MGIKTVFLMEVSLDVDIIPGLIPDGPIPGTTLIFMAVDGTAGITGILGLEVVFGWAITPGQVGVQVMVGGTILGSGTVGTIGMLRCTIRGVDHSIHGERDTIHIGDGEAIIGIRTVGILIGEGIFTSRISTMEMVGTAILAEPSIAQQTMADQIALERRLFLEAERMTMHPDRAELFDREIILRDHVW